jgi:hypothetical protein
MGLRLYFWRKNPVICDFVIIDYGALEQHLDELPHKNLTTQIRLEQLFIG